MISHFLFIREIIQVHKVENILKGSLDLIPSPSVKIQSIDGKTLLGVVNKLLKTKSLLTSPGIVLP